MAAAKKKKDGNGEEQEEENQEAQKVQDEYDDADAKIAPAKMSRALGAHMDEDLGATSNAVQGAVPRAGWHVFNPIGGSTEERFAHSREQLRMLIQANAGNDAIIHFNQNTLVMFEEATKVVRDYQQTGIQDPNAAAEHILQILEKGGNQAAMLAVRIALDLGTGNATPEERETAANILHRTEANCNSNSGVSPSDFAQAIQRVETNFIFKELKILRQQAAESNYANTQVLNMQRDMQRMFEQTLAEIKLLKRDSNTSTPTTTSTSTSLSTSVSTSTFIPATPATASSTPTLTPVIASPSAPVTSFEASSSGVMSSHVNMFNLRASSIHSPSVVSTALGGQRQAVHNITQRDTVSITSEATQGNSTIKFANIDLFETALGAAELTQRKNPHDEKQSHQPTDDTPMSDS